MKYVYEKNFFRRDKSKLNPYIYAIRLILSRIRWDVSFTAAKNRNLMRALKNSLANEKALLLCNGPSLNKVDFNSIPKNIYTVGLNKINLLFDKTAFRPDCIIATNMQVIEQNREFYNSTNIQLFLDSKAYTQGLIKQRNNIVFFHSALMPGFAKDCTCSINPQHTVTNTAFQILFHLGARDVGLAGIDHSFAVQGKANAMIEGVSQDFSHFDPNYFKDVKWQLPDLVESEIGYIRAKAVFSEAGGRVVNCTDGGELEIFPRISLDSFLNGC